ncbi:glycosyltransferase family 2 protein [Butyrivibrio sp. TB]|uniref:glycosyltransferase family 2 protein n=1 Tax=Butyrivibrio sp. TB TaxID=1520809 RepID=UPI0008AE6563|nr:glycosyltransferase family 2 protein [Butyrivibrio sp. TB]SEP95737.1 Glycosyl transferase family 2 [Butyrivibrio sp. TB]
MEISKPGKNFISIIVPVYNAENCLPRCVQSILAQTYKNFELILVDDGSTDSSSKLCDSYVTDYGAVPSVFVKHTKNMGVSHARNEGLSYAEGEWITFIDADDYIEPDYLERLISPIESRQNAISIARDEGATVANPTVISVITMTDQIIDTQPISGFYFLEHGILNRDAHVWSKLYSKDIMEGMRFEDDLTIGEDMVLLVKLAIKIGNAKSVLSIDAGSYKYYDNENGAMNSSYKPSYMDQIRCWQRAEELLTPYKDDISNVIFAQLATTQIVSAMLVAGKIAQVPYDDNTKDAIAKIREALSHACNKDGAFAGLSKGYKLKASIFRFSPRLYLKLYGTWKKNK